MRTVAITLLLVSAACTTEQSSERVATYWVQLSDGSYDLYGGSPQTIEAITAGAVADEHSPFVFYKLHAPKEAVEAAFAKAGSKTFTISLEDAHPDFEVVVHLPDDGSPGKSIRHVARRPGDPWTTGFAQIYFPVSRDTLSTSPVVGMFELTVYRPVDAPTGFRTISTETYRNGSIVDSSSMPMLKYPPDRKDSWPPIPENWK